MPSLTHFHLLLSVLLGLASLADLLPLHASQDLLPETSGEESQNVAEADEYLKLVPNAKHLHRLIEKLRDEQFQQEFGENNMNMTSYAAARIQTPLLEKSDRCLSKDFSTQKCFKRIYAGLKTYRDYLHYIERENLNASVVNDVEHKTINLLNTIQDKIEDGHIEPYTDTTLPDESAWTRKIATHSVLYNFTIFMKEASRAIQFASKSREVGTGHGRSRPKEAEWPSGKSSQE